MKEAHQCRVDDERMRAGGELAVIANAQAFNSRFAHLTNKRSKLPGQFDVRLDLLEFFGGNGRKVDRVADHAGFQEIAKGGGGFDADELLAFPGRRRDMRTGHDLRQLLQRVVRRRLRRVDVQGGAADMPALDRFDQRGLVDQLAAGGVDQLQALLALAQPLGVEGVTGLRRRRHVQRQVVGACAQIVERHQLDVQLGRDVRRDERIVRDHGHLERLGAARDFLADSTQPGKPEDLAADFLAEKTLLVPLALLH